MDVCGLADKLTAVAAPLLVEGTQEMRPVQQAVGQPPRASLTQDAGMAALQRAVLGLAAPACTLSNRQPTGWAGERPRHLPVLPGPSGQTANAPSPGWTSRWAEME